MTVYEFMRKMGKDEKFFLKEHLTDITKGKPTSIDDVTYHYEERENVLDALEYNVLTVDMAEGTIYCER